MRVVYSFPDVLGKPGIGTTAYHQVRGLLEEGAQVDVYCAALHPGARMPKSARVVTTLTVLNRKVPHRALGIGRAYRFHDRRVAAALARMTDVDVVHVWPRATLATAAAARRVGARTLRQAPNTHTAYAYEIAEREATSLGLNQLNGHSHSFDANVLELEEAEYRAVDAVLVPSEFVRSTFVDRGYPAERLLVNRFGFDPETYFPNGRSASPESAFRFLFVGSCEPRKGLHYALRAWHASDVADTSRFTICGDFVPGYREALGSLLSHPNAETIPFTSDVATLMRSSDALVLPSVEEGSALVTYEAQGCGCILLVSDAAGARVDHLRTGLVHEATNVDQLTHHFRLVAGDHELARRLRRATLARSESLTWASAARDLIGLYGSVLSRA
jgi:D-inositol-3-phosphate glycosyltransferase